MILKVVNGRICFSGDVKEQEENEEEQEDDKEMEMVFSVERKKLIMLGIRGLRKSFMIFTRTAKGGRTSNVFGYH